MNHAVIQVMRDISTHHPAFAGHFPGEPLLPGAAVLAEVLEAILDQPSLAQRLGTRPNLALAKFLAPVRPGCSLCIQLEEQADSLHFEVRHGALAIARGRFALGRARS